MTSQKIHHRFPMEYKICTDKLPAAANVDFPGVKCFVHGCHYSQRLDLQQLQGKGEHEHSITD